MKLTQSLCAKTVAVFLVFFTSIGLLVGVVGAIYANELDLYSSGSNDYFESSVCEDSLRSDAADIAYLYFTDENFAVDIKNNYSYYSAIRTNIVFRLTENGKEIISNGYPEASKSQNAFYFTDKNGFSQIPEPENGELSDEVDSRFVCIDIGLDPLLKKADGYYSAYTVYNFMSRNKTTLLWLGAISAIMLAALVVFLCCAAGHRAGCEGITLNPQDKIPYDLYLFCFIYILFAFSIDMSQFVINDIYGIVSCAVLFGIASLMILAVILTTVSRIKAGKWWRNTLIFMALSLIFKITKRIVMFSKDLICSFRIEWKVFLGVSLFLSVFSLLVYNSFFSGEYIFISVVMGVLALYAACSFARKLHIVFEGAKKIAGGEVDYKIDTSRLTGELKTHGDDLNSIADGLSVAVEQRIKSERMKTELITNVSHDIKTPLTSIINYVDLLKKQPLEGQASKYADTLEKNAARLKKLTEDLVEASKAASGSISLQLAEVNICELLNQAVGEYSERLAVHQIEPVVEVPETPVYILADGRLMWRIIDNLLSNAAKYSQEGTRLYISLVQRDEKIILEMKNISKTRLNINADELMERFVRGDASRHTEGSGLGLNIAKSLAELQSGNLSLEIDGDLFKAKLTFENKTEKEIG